MPSVARKTPPFLPTSSPRTQTRSSRSISSVSASRTPSISVLTAMCLPPRLAFPLKWGGDLLRENVPAQVGRVGLGGRLGRLHRFVHLLRTFLLQQLVGLIGQHALIQKVVPEPLERVSPKHRLQLLLRPVPALVVVGGVGGEASHLGVDQGRTPARAGPLDRFFHRLVDA